ncbi:MAG: hypothetical protein AAGE59_19725 [Cyanobacteria bacterium P01_F01_bin.86]
MTSALPAKTGQTKQGDASTDSKQAPQYMNVKFYDSKLEQRFREYCKAIGMTMNGVFNEFMKAVLEVSDAEDCNFLADIERAMKVHRAIDWTRIETALQTIQQNNPMANGATTDDMVLSLINEALTAHEQRRAKVNATSQWE